MIQSLSVPVVAVLLATHNGSRWLAEQLTSILRQDGARTRIVASDDHSHDDTPTILARFAEGGALEVLGPTPARFGNANRNFMRLIADAQIGDADLVAFADQDDIWLPHKLRRAAERMTAAGLDAYSSDVIAFWPDGRQRTLVKSGALRSHDHLFESAGPGCTFVLTRPRFLELQAWVRAHRASADAAKIHDWLIYALARTRGWRWEIDSSPGLMYRQHAANAVGANVGWRAARARLREALSGRYRSDAIAIAELTNFDTALVRRLRRLRWDDRLVLAARAAQCRRRRAEAIALAALFLLMRRH